MDISSDKFSEVPANRNSSKRTLFPEFDAIDIAIKIIDLLSILHDKNIIHTDLNPANIFLKNADTAKMQFQNLYHCSWKPTEIMSQMNLGAEYEDNISLYDTRTRNKHYISPEQIQIGNELADIVIKKNGKIEENTYDIQEFLILKKNQKPKKITKKCDIYSIGAIIFKMLLGRAPSAEIS